MPPSQQRVSKSSNTNRNINLKHNISNYYNIDLTKLYNATIATNSIWELSKQIEILTQNTTQASRTKKKKN